MAAKLCAHSAAAREAFSEAGRALGIDIEKCCDDLDRLTATEYAQPAILTCSVAAYRALVAELARDLAVDVVIAAGHSLGEVSALTAAGGLTLGDAVTIVRERGRLMQIASPPGHGLMAAVFGIPAASADEICRAVDAPSERVVVANYNSSTQLTISGHAAAVRRACAALDAAGAVTQELPISIAAHSPLMTSAAEGFARALAGCELVRPRWPLVSNLTGRTYRSDQDLRAALVDQLTHPVRWLETMRAIDECDVDCVVEVGPKTVLRDLLKAELPARKCLSFGAMADIDAVRWALSAERFATGEPKRLAFLHGCLRIAVTTRNRMIEIDRYDKVVVGPYRELDDIRAQCRASGEPPSDAHIRKAVELTRRILKGKRLPEEERVRRIGKLVADNHMEPLVPDLQP